MKFKTIAKKKKKRQKIKTWINKEEEEVEEEIKSICIDRDNNLTGNDRLIMERWKHYFY